ncbi:MAG TPA: hypothetical protein DDY68_00635 [Porphyromonadaceae bacterium]|nr:hypothetical protein [Porphyromonadaceae bacterium]
MEKIQSQFDRLKSFMSSPKGKQFFNYAYNWGASVVVAGALFKILHLAGANVMLSIGMGVEVFIFFISGFDYSNVLYSPKETPSVSQNEETKHEGETKIEQSVEKSSIVQPTISYRESTPIVQIPPVVYGGETLSSLQDSAKELRTFSESMKSFAEVAEGMKLLSQSIRSSYESMLQNGSMGNDPSKGYAKQMEELNRNLSGLNTIYEIQLRGISSQISTIEQINAKLNAIKEMYEHSTTGYCEESEKMTRLMSSLNEVYVRMLEAMKISSPAVNEK